ncbi:MAG: hypothetical protein ACUVQP_03955 [Bacteroidales bacterium]
MITLVERKGSLSIIKKVEAKNAKLVSKEIIKPMKKYKGLVKSITFDNGFECAEHAKIKKLWDARYILQKHIAFISEGQMKILMVCFANTYPKDLTLIIIQMVILNTQ